MAEDQARKLKLGFVQLAPVLGDLAGNRARLKQLIGDTPEADLLVLPELCNSGYNFESHEQAVSTSESASDGPFVRFLTEICATRQMHIVAGLNERDADRLYNTAVLVGPNGVVGKYRKMHLFLNEFDHFERGDLGLPVFEVDGYRVGLLICFDWLFPEVWRILALRGADIICHPSNLVLPGYCQRALPTYGFINKVFVVTANRVGTERGVTFTGLSAIVSPAGVVLAEAAADTKESRVVQVDLADARNKMATARNHVLNDRRPEEYGDLVLPRLGS
jgi:predicted amidohydrolase